ncbi:MAG: ASCH domain-containing protein [Pseudomonadota bacterium]
MIGDLAGSTAALWRGFMALSTTPVDARFYDVMRIGDTAGSADLGAAAILSGRKTATSALPEDFAADLGPPPIGSFSVVLDGGGAAVCVVRTVALSLCRFDALDAGFARDYGEWDGSLETLRRELGAHYGARAAALGLDWHEEREILCEWFEVVHRASAD